MSDITLVMGNKNYSSWSLRPWVLLRHLQLPFEELLIPLDRPETRSLIAQHSPTGRVPVLKHGERFGLISFEGEKSHLVFKS